MRMEKSSEKKERWRKKYKMRSDIETFPMRWAHEKHTKISQSVVDISENQFHHHHTVERRRERERKRKSKEICVVCSIFIRTGARVRVRWEQTYNTQKRRHKREDIIWWWRFFFRFFFPSSHAWLLLCAVCKLFFVVVCTAWGKFFLCSTLNDWFVFHWKINDVFWRPREIFACY